MIAEWIDYELRNWAAWCHSGEPAGPKVQRSAASAEGHYLPPSDMGDPPEPRAPRPNRERAEVVHAVYLRQLDRRERRAMVLRYVDGYPERKVPRLMRVSDDMYRAAMLSVARRIGEAFRSHD